MTLSDIATYLATTQEGAWMVGAFLLVGGLARIVADRAAWRTRRALLAEIQRLVDLTSDLRDHADDAKTDRESCAQALDRIDDTLTQADFKAAG